MPVFALLVVVQLLRAPITNGITFILTIAGIAAASALFLRESEMVVDDNSVAKRSLLGFWRRARRTDVGGIAFRSVGFKHVGIVHRTDGRCVFWITADVWDQSGLETLAQLLGSSLSERPSTYSAINQEFPGTFPRWLAFYERHPLSTIAILVVAVLALCVVGIMVGDLVTVGHLRG